MTEDSQEVPEEQERPQTQEEWFAKTIEGKSEEELAEFLRNREIAHSFTCAVQRLFILSPTREETSDRNKEVFDVMQRIDLPPVDDKFLQDLPEGLEGAVDAASHWFTDDFVNTLMNQPDPMSPHNAMRVHGTHMMCMGVILGLAFAKGGYFLGIDPLKVPAFGEVTEEAQKVLETERLADDFRRSQIAKTVKDSVLTDLMSKLAERGVNIGDNVLTGTPEEVSEQLADKIMEARGVIGGQREPSTGQYL